MIKSRLFQLIAFPLVAAISGVLISYYYIAPQNFSNTDQSIEIISRTDSSGIIIEVDVPMGKAAPLAGENWCNCNWAPSSISTSFCPGERHFVWAGSPANPAIYRISITKPATSCSVAHTVKFMLKNTGTAVSYFDGSDWECLTSNNFCLTGDNRLNYDNPSNEIFFVARAGASLSGTQLVIIHCSSTYQITLEQRGTCSAGG